MGGVSQNEGYLFWASQCFGVLHFGMYLGASSLGNYHILDPNTHRHHACDSPGYLKKPPVPVPRHKLVETSEALELVLMMGGLKFMSGCIEFGLFRTSR